VAAKTFTGTSTPANDTAPFQIERGTPSAYPIAARGHP
jgi:hypothetical protein